MECTTTLREATIIDDSKSHFPEYVTDAKIDSCGRVTISIDKDHLSEIAKWMRDDLELDHLKGVIGVDYPTHKKIEALYLLGSFSKNEIQDILVILKVDLPRDNPSVSSVVSIWPSAHFHEREAFEMFGINFVGHPDLRKLLTLDNWDGPPPMLKDIKFPEMGQR
jgi:NADH:ubiquinone oxidoreductase subunit C